MHHNWAKAWEPSWFETLVELLFNDPGVTKDPNGPVAEQLAGDPMLRKAGFEAGTVTTPDGPAVYMVQTRQAFERTRSVA